MSHREQVSSVEVVSEEKDNLGGSLERFAQYCLVALFAVLPVFFTPGLWATLDFDKTYLTLVGALVVTMILSMLALRKVRVRTILPLSLGLFWMVAFAAFASGVISGDTQDALRGNMLETQTAAFFAVMALVTTVTLALQGSKKMTSRALLGFAVTSSLLLLYVSLRLIFGADLLPFQSFTAITTSPIGTFNDLAIFAGLTIILSLIALAQLPIRSGLQYLFAVPIVISLFILSVVNFFNIWLIVGFLAFLVLMYFLARDTVFRVAERDGSTRSRALIAIAGSVCLVSVAFTVAGDQLGQKMGQWTGVNYVEVRPSLEATVGITRAVYSENALFGIGANRFADAWRLHKDPTINETIFWDTDFIAGSGFVPTVFVNLGLLGGVLLVSFHLGLLYLGYRMLLRPTKRDPYWYYFGTITFAATCFIWGISYVYVPGAAILLLGAFFTGLTFVAAAALLPGAVRTIPLVTNRQRGFMLMASIILVTVVSVAGIYSVGKQYVAEANFNEARATSTSPEALDQAAAAAYQLYPDERFRSAQAQIQLAILTGLLGVTEPTEEQQELFNQATKAAITAAEEAVSKDPTDPDHHVIRAGILMNLTAAGLDEARVPAEISLADAEKLDPLNPGYQLLRAQMAARAGDIESARTAIAAALVLKRNFTEAMYLSAQLDVSEGKTVDAIATTRSIITLEPRNPTRYFQLGVLLSATDDIPGAIAAYRAAIALDSQYANARYMLALAHLSAGETDEALAQLDVVRVTNQDNQALTDLIAQVQSGEYQVPQPQAFEAPVQERTTEGTGNDTLDQNDVTSDLVTPVNTIPGQSTGSEQVMQPVESETSEPVPPATEEVAVPEVQ